MGKKETKVVQWQQYLEKNDVKCFSEQKIEDGFNAVLYRSFMEVQGQKLTTVVVLDDSIYTMIQVLIASKVAVGDKKNELLAYIDELNGKYKVFKYHTTAGGDLVLESCIPAAEDSFDPKIVSAVIDVILKHLTEEYPNIMQKVWSKVEKA